VRRFVLLIACAATALLQTAACDRSRLSGGSPDAAAHGADVDPMEFVILHAQQMNTIIRDHPGDCEGCLAQLLRYVADNRRSFLETPVKKGSARDALPSAGEEATRLLMGFAGSCPAQTARLNQALHALAD